METWHTTCKKHAACNDGNQFSLQDCLICVEALTNLKDMAVALLSISKSLFLSDMSDWFSEEEWEQDEQDP